MSQPSEAPPSYEAATTSHKTRNGIPPASRRSMEDESRELPHGWVRQFDAGEGHQFFVDTTANPPRSIWCHPYDDPTYMNSLSSEERRRIEGLHRIPSEADIAAESSDDDEAHHKTTSSGHGHASGSSSAQLPPRPEPEAKGARKLGRRLKDKLTQSTHQEREQQRAHRAEQEARAFEMHQKVRAAMSRALQTGEPQLLGRDKDGKEVWIEPPGGNAYPGNYGGGHGGGFGGGYGGGYGYNPYQSGVYATPNARYIRPAMPYGRPYGAGYGGGYGMPLAAGLGGGLLFGSLLGASMF